MMAISPGLTPSSTAVRAQYPAAFPPPRTTSLNWLAIAQMPRRALFRGPARLVRAIDGWKRCAEIVWSRRKCRIAWEGCETRLGRGWDAASDLEAPPPALPPRS